MEINPEIKKATDPIYQKVSRTIPEIEWSIHAPYIYKINKLKKKRMQSFLHIIIKHRKYIMVFLIFQQTLLHLQLKQQKLKQIL